MSNARLQGLVASRFVVSAFAVAACGTSSITTPDLLEPTKTGEAFEGTQCSAIRPPTEPDLMGWDSGSRLNLKALQETGVVGVRYKAEGCNVELEVLNCVGKGAEYKFSPYSATETKTAKSQRDLFAELPIGAARLGGKVGGGRALRTDYMLAGLLATPVMKTFPADQLDGDCDRATHVVSKVYLGGFAMAAGESEALSATASIFGVGAGGSQDRTAERLAREGNADACEKAQREGTREVGCSVPLRIGLTRIEGRAAGARVDCPPGSQFEEGRCVATDRIARVDLDNVILESAVGKRAKAELKTVFDQRQNELNKKQAELKNRAADLEKQEAALGADKTKEKRAQHQRETADLQALYIKYQREVGDLERRRMKELGDKITAIAGKVATEQGFIAVYSEQDLIWSKSGKEEAAKSLGGAPRTDLSEAVRKRADAELK